jgi:hypothetical protein
MGWFSAKYQNLRKFGSSLAQSALARVAVNGLRTGSKRVSVPLGGGICDTDWRVMGHGLASFPFAVLCIDATFGVFVGATFGVIDDAKAGVINDATCGVFSALRIMGV